MMTVAMSRRARIAALLIATGLGGCAAPHPGGNAPALRDPYEKFNRGVYGFNKGLDHYALLPATKVYRFAIPQPARRGVSNIISNLTEPLSFINAIAQGKPREAWHVLKRFAINSTIGVGGLADHATNMGLPQQSEDFGQTLAVWGVKSGPFLMLPGLGPSTFRDGVGFAVDSYTDPVFFARHYLFHPGFTARAAQFAVQTLDLRSKLIDAGADDVLKSSLDEYATVRSAYLQRRQSEIYDGSPPDEDDAPVPDAPLAPGATPPEKTTTPATPSPAVTTDKPADARATTPPQP